MTIFGGYAKIPNKEYSISALRSKLEHLKLQFQEISDKFSDNYHQLTENKKVLKQMVTQINTHLSHTEDSIEDMKLIAFNASITAFKSGDKGKGFGVITKQLIQLAEFENQEAQKILEEVANTDLQINRIDEYQARMKESLEILKEDTFEPNKQEILSALEKTEASVEEMQTQLNNSQEQINELMMLIKQENITHQGIEHLNIVQNKWLKFFLFLDTFNIESGNLTKLTDFLFFIQNSTQMSLSLILQIQDETRTMLRCALSMLDQLRLMGNLLVQINDNRQDNTQTEIDGIDQNIKTTNSCLELGSATFEDQADSFGEVILINKRIVKHLTQISQNRNWLTKLNVLIKIEIGRSNLVEGQAVSRTIDEICKTTNNLNIPQETVENIIGYLTSSREGAQKIARQQIAQKQTLKNLQNSIEEHLNYVIKLMLNTSELGQKILNTAESLADSLTPLNKQVDNIDHHTVHCAVEEKQRDLFELLPERFKKQDLSSIPIQLQDLINKFPVLEYKQSASGTVGMDDVTGDEERTLTLF